MYEYKFHLHKDFKVPMKWKFKRTFNFWYEKARKIKEIAVYRFLISYPVPEL